MSGKQPYISALLGASSDGGFDMATERQRQAARRNLVKARQAQSARAGDSDFAFPEQRKEPLVDAAHVRNAIARFDQVEDVTDAERDRAWQRICAAARRYDIEVSAGDWRDLVVGGRAHKR